MVRANVRIRQAEAKTNRRYEVVTNGFNGLAGKRFHFIGAGGIGMSGLATLLVKHKAIVTGSDQTAGIVIDRLSSSGADIKIGHKEHNLDPATDAVVISAAIREENPELKLARQLSIRVYKYAEMLGKLFNFYSRHRGIRHPRQKHNERLAGLYSQTRRPRPDLHCRRRHPAIRRQFRHRRRHVVCGRGVRI